MLDTLIHTFIQEVMLDGFELLVIMRIQQQEHLDAHRCDVSKDANLLKM